MPLSPTLRIYCEKRPLPKPADTLFPRVEEAALLDIAHVEELRTMGVDVGDPDDPRSMLRLIADYEPYGLLREGTWYELPVRALGLTFAPEPVGTGPSLIRGTLTAKRPIRGAMYRIPPLLYPIPQTYRQTDYHLPLIGSDKFLEVVDCGQGNWNEISTASHRIIYDTGCAYLWTGKQIQTFIQSRQIASDTRQIQILISHWDVDHYHALLEAGGAELGRVSWLIGPDNLPKTATLNRFLSHVQHHGVNIRLLPPQARLPGDGRRIVLHKAMRNKDFVLFRATTGASRNQTGIVLGIHGEQWNGVLTGDHHHAKVLSALRTTGLLGSPLLYVVPHHGGRAGAFDVRKWQANVSAMVAAISYGKKNPYGHPLSKYSQRIQAVACSLHETAKHGDGQWAL